MFENDVCDLECNSYACDYDRGMCCAPIKRPEFVAFDLSKYVCIVLCWEYCCCCCCWWWWWW